MMLCDDIRNMTNRALWEMENLMNCIPKELWDKRYDAIPMWKYVYHTLRSMDRWFINPNDSDYKDPEFHTEFLGNLNVIPKDEERISQEQLFSYFYRIQDKIRAYLEILDDSMLPENPPGCDMSRFILILGQFRHWHRHMGVIYGFIIKDAGRWPYVLNMLGKIPDQPMPNYYE